MILYSHVKTKPHTNTRKRSYLWGLAAEYFCAAALIFKGYSILSLRYRNYGGEIDIIARKGKTVIFAEVKARTSQEAALYSVSPAKQQVIARAASGFIATRKKYSQHDLRFDVMVITSPAKIHHIKDAWRL